AGKVTFDITKAAIAANVGKANKTVTLDYEVTRNGKVVSSQVLTVTVTPIPATVLDNTIVRINEADTQTKILDLSSDTANRTIRIGTWPFITSGSEVYLELRGVSGGAPFDLKIWNGGSSKVNPTWVSQGWWEVTLSYEFYLKKLDLNTLLEVNFSTQLTPGYIGRFYLPYTLYFLVKPATFYDLTTFNNHSMNGWSMSFGQSAEVKLLEGNYYLALGLKRDSTYKARLDKYYSNLQPGRRYRFSFEVKRVSSNYTVTVLVEDAQYKAYYTNQRAWFLYIGTFTAGTQSSGKPIRVSLVFDTDDANLDSLQIDNIYLHLL
ncbi:carbohydrate binding domain-containing protein, partial [Pseudomonas sp.]